MPTNVYAGSRSVKVGAGTLYYAPLGTAEPTSATASMPSGWIPVGYTEQGSTFSYNITTASITPEEEIDPVLNYVTGRTATMAFNMLEVTAQNLSLALNSGGAPSGTLADGTIYFEPPTPGSEVRVMLAWDSAYDGNAPVLTSDYERILMRQVLQTGNFQVTHRKAPNAATYSVTFTAEKPATGLQPVRFYKPSTLAQ